MAFSYVVDGVLVTPRAVLPASARRLSDQAWVMGLATASAADQESCGYFVITETAPPTPAANQRLVEDIVLVDGRPVQQWTLRAETPEEGAIRLAAENREALMAQVASNVATLLATVTALNEITGRTNANINDNPAVAIKDLTREVKTVARQTIRISRAFARVLDSANSGS